MPSYIYLFMVLLLVALVDLNSLSLRVRNSDPSASKQYKWDEKQIQTPVGSGRDESDDQVRNSTKKSLDCPPTYPKVQWNLAGIPGDGYYISAQIGTPPQTVNLLVDTGSSNLAVAGANDATLDTFFKPNDSSSFVMLNNTRIKVAYTQGWWEGELGSDVVVLPSLACHLQTRSFVALIRRSHSFYVAGSHWQGILGLAFPELAQPNKSVQPWFDSLLSAHNFSHQLGQQLHSHENNADETNSTTPLLLEMPDMNSDEEATIVAPSTELAPNAPHELPLPRNAYEEDPDTVKEKFVVQTNENLSLPHDVVKVVSNSSFIIGKSSQNDVLKNNIDSYRNDSLSSDESDISKRMNSEGKRTKLLHFSNISNSSDDTLMRNVDVFRENEDSIMNSEISQQFALSKTKFSAPVHRQIFNETITRPISASHLDNNEVTTVETFPSPSDLHNTLHESQPYPSQIESTNLTPNMMLTSDGSDYVTVDSTTDDTLVPNNIPNGIHSSTVNNSIEKDIPNLRRSPSIDHEEPLVDDGGRRQRSLGIPAAVSSLGDSDSSSQAAESLSEEPLGAGGGGVLSNTFGMELCGPWSSPQHDSHYGRIMLGSLVDSCGDGPWFEAPILQPWFYEVAVTSMAVGGQPLDLPCTLYNTHASIVDSGTTKLKLPDAVLDAVVAALEAAVHERLPEPLPENFWRGEGQVCWTDANTAWSVLPSLSIQIALSNSSSFSIELGPRSYLRPAPIAPGGTTLEEAASSSSSSQDSVQVMSPFLDKSELAPRFPTLASLDDSNENADIYEDEIHTDNPNVDGHSTFFEIFSDEVTLPENKVLSYPTAKNTSTSMAENSETFISTKLDVKNAVDGSLTHALDLDDANAVKSESGLLRDRNLKILSSSRKKRSVEGEVDVTGTSATTAPPLPAVPCWTTGIEPSNMGTVLGVVVLEGLCTRFDRGRGVLGFRRGHCGPAVTLKGPIPHAGAGSCVPGSGGAGTVVLGSLLAVLCCPLLVYAIRWLVVSLRRNAPRLRSSADAPFLTLDEAPNMFGEQ